MKSMHLLKQFTHKFRTKIIFLHVFDVEEVPMGEEGDVVLIIDVEVVTIIMVR